MAPRMSAEAQTLLKLLADGAWHDLDPLTNRLGATVAPGKALRRYEQNETNRALHHGPRKGPPLSEDEKIASGRRAIATDTVTSLKKRYIEVTDATTTGEPRRARRRAQIVPIADPRAAALPELTTTAPTDPPTDEAGAEPEPEQADPVDPGWPPATTAMAFFGEAQVRAIVAEEVARAVGHALDGFQRGMQTWLIGRFAEVERAVRRDRDRPRPRPPGGGPQHDLPSELRRR